MSISKIGAVISKNSKQGGGKYVVTSHLNCDRCKKVIEEREILEPNKTQSKKGSYHARYKYCKSCGLYEPVRLSRLYGASRIKSR